MNLRKQLFLFVLFFLGFTFQTIAQDLDSLRAEFSSGKNQEYGFDSPGNKQGGSYEEIIVGGYPYRVPYKSIGQFQKDTVEIALVNSSVVVKRDLSFRINDSLVELARTALFDDKFKIVLPAMKDSYSLEILCRDSLIGKLNVIVYPHYKESIIVVPLVAKHLNVDSLQKTLNGTYRQANLEFSVRLAPLFQPEGFESSILRNPSPEHDRFSDQMTDLRDAYFEAHPSSGAYYIFIVEGFVDEKIQGYMVQNKAIAFVKYSEDSLFHTIVQQFGYGAGALEDSIMIEGIGADLNFAQWELIQHNCHTVSYYDDYEDVRTNNGLIAYYFWEEDEKGNITMVNGKVLKGIKRPFKRNQYSRHLNIKNIFFIPLFKIGSFHICSLHFILLILLFIGSIYLRKKIYRWLWSRIQSVWFFRVTIRFTVFVAFIFTYVGSFSLLIESYNLFEVKSGKLDYLYNKNVSESIRLIGENKNTERLEEERMGSAILIKRGDEWFLQRRKKVLYFNVTKKDDSWSNYVFKTDSDTLTIKTKDYCDAAESHYFVFNYLTEDGQYAFQKVYNHLGKEITDKLELKDPAKRILLFVNGYRPTSLGQTFEENFADIRKNGLEFPNSSNLIYSFDRYDYWRPWKEIDALFQERLNPGETFYADGHFSVSTSNHRSLLDFTTLTATYPKRCKDGVHVCQKTTVNSWIYWGAGKNIPTVDLHNLKPNKKGFNSRKLNGKIAGRNLQQMFNELPNKSNNDTLYIVAHSMGYAYSLGIIEQLRGKINFGGLYIIAPENASAGEVNLNEWSEVWQYGSNFDANHFIAPCLLDGIAPQTKAGGLKAQQRTFIPEKFYTKMGFFDSHFIGNYTWVFDIPENETGHIRQFY